MVFAQAIGRWLGCLGYRSLARRVAIGAVENKDTRAIGIGVLLPGDVL